MRRGLLASILGAILLIHPGVCLGGGPSPELLEMLRARATGPDPDGSVEIPLVEGEVRIDGRLDEDFWAEALVWRMPYEIGAGQNREAPLDTYVLLATDSRNFLVAFVNFDPAPEDIRGTYADRDRWSRNSDDAVGLYIDTFGDRRNAYYLMVNARGVQFDAMRLDRGGQGTHDDSSFDFLWASSSEIGSEGYVVEIALPFQYMRIGNAQNGRVEWGLMPFRLAPRDFRYKMTPFPWDFSRNCFLCQVPTVVLRDPDSAFRPLQFIPYASGIGEGDAGHVERSLSAGVDVKYQNPTWVLDATLSPDFSQVETDSFLMTTNIRFLPALPERRPFFMERADLFRFPISQIIYTRTLLDPTAGLRWTGKQGPHNWAVLNLHDRSTWLLFPGKETSRTRVLEDVSSWNTIGRYRYDRSERAVMGIFVTDRQYEGGFNRLFSADGQFAVGDQHTFVTHFIASSTRYPGETARANRAAEDLFHDMGYLLRFNRSGRAWSYSMETRDYGENLVSGMGFLQQVGVRRASAETSYDFWPEGDLVRNVRAYASFSGIWDRSNLETLSRGTQMGVQLAGTRQTSADAFGRISRESFAGIPFDLHEAGITLSTSLFPWLQTRGGVARGQAIDFRLVERMSEFRGGLGNTLFLFDRRLQLTHTLDRLHLFHAVDAQKAWIQGVRADLQLTARLSVRNIAQWRDFRWLEPRYADSVPGRRETFENQTLFRYRIDYATAIYFGFYNQREYTDSLSRDRWNVFGKVSLLL
jgi:hypothetical protein